MAKNNRRLEVYLSFLGGAGDEYTGSSAFVPIIRNGKRTNLLVDCGMYQGDEYTEKLNYEFPLQGSKVDFAFLTHAHVDHCGLFPFLCNNGYRGPIFATAETIGLTINALNDVAGINARKKIAQNRSLQGIKRETSRERIKAKQRKFSQRDYHRLDSIDDQIDDIQSNVLYTKCDVMNMLHRFVPVEPNEYIRLSEGIGFKFIPNNHGDGAVSLELYITCGEEHKNIVFSGDIGPSFSYLYRVNKLKPNYNMDFCVMETIHGSKRERESFFQGRENFRKMVFNAIRSGNIGIIVTFSERSALIVKLLNEMLDEGLDAEVWLDSTLLCEQLAQHTKFYKKGGSKWFKPLGTAPFDTSRFKKVKSHKQHLNLVHDIFKPKIVVTTSGMADGGRVLDYLNKYVKRKNAEFIFTGYMTTNSQGYKLCMKPSGSMITINGNRMMKSCTARRIYGFSSHGYIDEYMAFFARYPSCRDVFLNHASKKSKEEVKVEIEKRFHGSVNTYLPERMAQYRLSKKNMEQVLSFELSKKLF